jgi:protein-S-isoprenylcysteine O-methyltransferase Ste14
MNTPKITPKDFFLWAGAMLALYISVFSFVSLIFSYVDFAFPDALDYNYDPYSSAMRASIASLVVLFPLALVLLRFIRKGIERDPSRGEIWIRRWALVFTVFLATIGAAVDLITLINYFLGGDLTTRFVLKVAVVFLVAAGFFMHFLADIWGYWNKNPQYARMVGWAAAAVVLITIVSGFFLMGSPSQIRMMRFDDQKVMDLQNIQSQVTYYWQSKQKLPVNSHELEDPLMGFTLPKDPQTSQDYGYRITKAPYSFEVCADFNADSRTGSTDASVAQHYGGAEAETWKHTAGQNCFERTIDPDKYPPINAKTVPAAAPIR